jgi:ribonuclease HI
MPKKPPAQSAEVILFTDGACSGNPGPGGWAFILRHPASGKEIERSGAERTTTNNRMELTAVIRGLEALKRPASVELVTDSEYVGKGMSEWMAKWKANGWRRREGSRWAEVKNEDLWRRLDELLGRHRVTFTHVRGHTGHPENERCDQLAVAAYRRLTGDRSGRSS